MRYVFFSILNCFQIYREIYTYPVSHCKRATSDFTASIQQAFEATTRRLERVEAVQTELL